MTEKGLEKVGGGKLAQYQAPELSLQIVKDFINPEVTDQEAFFFVQFCKAQNLNPFMKEAYLIKYKGQTEPASIVVGYHNFLKRAEENPKYNGFRAGVILKTLQNKIEYREGAFYLAGEVILGGWAEVYRTDRSTPFRAEVTFEEYVGKRQDGTPNKQWKRMPGTMIRKVPVAHAHRDAFPSELGRLYVSEEFGQDETALPTYEVGKKAEIILPEGMEGFTKPQVAGEAGAAGEAAGGQGKENGGGQDERRRNEEGAALASEKQIKKIHALFGGLKIDDKDRKEWAAIALKVGSVEHFEELTVGQASTVIEALIAENMKRGKEDAGKGGKK